MCVRVFLCFIKPILGNRRDLLARATCFFVSLELTSQLNLSGLNLSGHRSRIDAHILISTSEQKSEPDIWLTNSDTGPDGPVRFQVPQIPRRPNVPDVHGRNSFFFKFGSVY